MGFNVSVTGGLDVDTLKLFEGIDVYTFITGRGITAAPDPVQAAQNFKDEIIRIWGNKMAQVGIYEKPYLKIFHGKNVLLGKGNGL